MWRWWSKGKNFQLLKRSISGDPMNHKVYVVKTILNACNLLED